MSYIPQQKTEQLNTVLCTHNVGEGDFPLPRECVFKFAALNMENVHSY